MLKLLDPDDYASNIEVRRMTRRLYASVAAALIGSCLFMVLAAMAANAAWKDGIASAQPQVTATQAVQHPARKPFKKQAVRRAAAAATKHRTVPVAGITSPAHAVPDAPATPPLLTYILILGGMGFIAVTLTIIVRRPLEAARWQAAELARAGQDLHATTLETFAALNAAVEAKDRYTAGHGLRVTLISILIGQEMGLADTELGKLRHAATFHDIGKIAVPDHVLQKPGRLTDIEFEQMKQHAIEGARICSKLQALCDAVPMIRSHHERMDGTGYPDGLLAGHIPIGARIISVADAWDAMTSDRPYRRGQPSVIALQEIRRCSGPQFDPEVVNAFLEVLARDPWMFGLVPEDLLADLTPVGLPEAPSRNGGHGKRRQRADHRDHEIPDDDRTFALRLLEGQLARSSDDDLSTDADCEPETEAA